MSNNHLSEPLDYLYEDLPPEGMAEARKHLAVCPDCRARVREIRETVKQYRGVRHPAPPSGLAARAAAAALAAAKSAVPAPEPRLVGTMAAGRGAAAGHGPAQPLSLAPVVIVAPSQESSEQRQARLEEDFAKLKLEVQGEMRRSRGRWFFHPAWTVAASALLAASLAIHFSPRARQYAQPVLINETAAPAVVSAPTGESARELRDREPIPEPPQPRAEVESAAVLHGETAPPLLRQANALAELPLPVLADSVDSAKETETADAAPVVEMTLAAAPAPAFAAPAAAEPKETTPLLTPDELAALLAAPVDAEDESATVIAMTDMAAPPQLIARPEGFDTAERIRTLTALAGMQIASGELADARKTAEMLREYDAKAAEEITALIAESEKAAAKKEEEEKEAENKAEPEPEPEQESEPRASKYDNIDTAPEPDPEPVEVPEEQEPALLVPVAPEELPPFDPVPASPVEQPLVASSLPEPFAGAMVEPPEDPPLSVVRVPAYMQPPVSLEIVAMTDEPVISESIPAPAGELRATPNPSRSNAALARALTSVGTEAEASTPVSAPIPVQPLESGHVIPLHVYIRPEPAAAPAPPPRERFTTDPYLRDD